MREIRLHDEALRDSHGIVRWYEQERIGLGREFLTDVETALAGIQSMPERHPLVGTSTRRALLVRFPFIVFYVVEEREILVTGLFHSHRNPRSWADRVREEVVSVERIPAPA